MTRRKAKLGGPSLEAQPHLARLEPRVVDHLPGQQTPAPQWWPAAQSELAQQAPAMSGTHHPLQALRPWAQEQWLFWQMAGTPSVVRQSLSKQQPSVAERCHHVSNGGRAQTLAVGEPLRNSLRRYGLAGCNVDLDDGCEHQPLSRADARLWHRD